MMISTLFVFFLACLFVGANGQTTYPKSSSSVQRKEKGKGFLSVCVGENVTLECSYEGSDIVQMFWYKQSLGLQPELMSSFYGYSSKVTFFDEFEKNPRFELDTENQNHHLKIFNMQVSDSATYHCIISDSFSVTFLERFSVHVRDPSYIQTSVFQSSSKNIHAGDSVTLNCTVHTGSCDGDHRVYWFKDSGDSRPGLIYTHGGRNYQCEIKNNTQTVCIYELHMENVDESHSGIYYCAVASCGHILFGNGTKLDIADSAASLKSVILHTLVGLLTIMSVLVVFLLWKINKSTNCTSTEERSSAASLRSSEAENKDTESLHYAGIKVNKSNRSRRQKNGSNTVCVYASVKQQN